MDRLPQELKGKMCLDDFLLCEHRGWPTTNHERGILIDKNIAGTITATERICLDALQAYIDYHISHPERVLTPEKKPYQLLLQKMLHFLSNDMQQKVMKLYCAAIDDAYERGKKDFQRNGS